MDPELAGYFALIQKRLAKGEVEYQDNPASSRPIDELLDEIEEEAADLAGWGFQAYRRVQRMRAMMRHPSIVTRIHTDWRSLRDDFL